MKIATYIFGGCVLIIALLLIFSTFPIAGNYKFYIVQSGSMEPAIKTGGIIFIKPISTYKIGDVITFGPVPKGKVPTTHRIIEARAESGRMIYVTKGDANEDRDFNEVMHKDVLGKVYFDVPFIGYILAAAKKPIGFIALIGVPAFILIYDEVKKIILEIKKIKMKKEEEIIIEKQKENV